MKTTRKLNFNDVFKMAKIIGKTGAKNEIIEFLQRGATKGENIKQLGIDFIWMIVEKAPTAEKEINAFLGGLCGKTEAEIANSDLTEICELFGDIIAENKDIKSFFMSALRSPTASFSTKS